MKQFNECIHNCNLLDLGFSEPKFTWERGRVKERLDRSLCNESWSLSFPSAFIIHLPPCKSDHRPILLRMSPKAKQRKPSDFKFLATWLSHESFPRIVKDCWKTDLSWLEGYEVFKKKAMKWNKTFFQNLAKHKKRLWNKIESINWQLSRGPNRHLENLISNFWRTYEQILLQEELTWYQKSRCKWLLMGDKNTKYFHALTMSHRSRNRILRLKSMEGSWIEEEANLKKMAVDYFKDLYSSNHFQFQGFLMQNCFLDLTVEALADMEALFTAEEIKGALFSMDPLKALRQDGIHAAFFQS